MTNYERYLDSKPLKEPPLILIASDAADRLQAELSGKEPAALILMDPDTAAAVSDLLNPEVLRAYGHRIRMLPRNPLPTLELVKEIAAEAKEHKLDLIVGAGSGVISDCAKQAACEAGIRNWCLMTAASVDAFTSGTAAIRVEGYHESLPTRAAERIYCDIRVLSKAPRRLTLAGLGDLAGKFIAVPDWQMSSMITGEFFDPVAAEFAVGSATLALNDLESILSGSESGCVNAADAVLTSGLIMQSLQSSRPASSTEHILAHFWEVEQLVGNREWDLHGVLVAAASRIVIRAYREILSLIVADSPDPGRGEHLFSAAAVPDASWISEKTRAKLQREIKARDNSPEGHKRRMEKLLPMAEELVKLYVDYLDTAEKGLTELGEAGLPLDLGSLGIDKERGRFGVNNIRFLRNRYTLLDAARDMGYDREAEEILNRAYESCF
jgi:glycerol-1-phosphate dehydrogenase [NAD(P)+]